MKTLDLQQTDEEDYDTRFQVADPQFDAEQDRIHREALVFLKGQLDAGRPWKAAASALKVRDEQFKAVILDDFLKITLAERHFQGGEGLKKIAGALKVPMDLLIALKQSMIDEVTAASVQAYHMSSDKPEPGDG